MTSRPYNLEKSNQLPRLPIFQKEFYTPFFTIILIHEFVGYYYCLVNGRGHYSAAKFDSYPVYRNAT